MIIRHRLSDSLVFILLLGLLLNGCRKENFIPVSGLITDPNQAIPVAGVNVEIWTQQIESGIFSANYILAGTIITGSDGKFLLNLENENYTGIRLIFSKEGYFGWETDLNLDLVKNDHRYFAEYQLLPKATLQIRVKNSKPYNSDDYFEFRILNGYSVCEACCKGEKYQFAGMDIDLTIDCQTVGHQNIIFQWSKRKNGEQIFKTEIHFIKAFETTVIRFDF